MKYMRNINFIVFILLTALTTTTPAQSAIELVRGAKEMTPAAYYELSQEAERLYIQKNYAKAAEAYEKLTRAYPWDGEKWQALAFALYLQGKYREAIEPFLKA